MHQHLADIGHLTSNNEGKPAKRIDVFINFRQLGVDGIGQIVELRTRVGFPQIGGYLFEQQLRLIVMFVFNLADDFFDKVFNRDQALGP